MPLKISYKDNYNGHVFRDTKDFNNHHIFRNKCWACNFFNMENIKVKYPYGLCVDTAMRNFCRLYPKQYSIAEVVHCPDFQEQLTEDYIPIIRLNNEYHILL